MDDITRADFARQILDNPLFREAFNALETDLARQRQAVKITDTELHTRLIVCEQVLSRFRDVLTRAIQDGDVAKLRMDLENKKNAFQRVFAR